MSKSRCKYCKVKLADEANIRCDTCDSAWNDGMDMGEKRIREMLSGHIVALLRLFGFKP